MENKQEKNCTKYLAELHFCSFLHIEIHFPTELEKLKYESVDAILPKRFEMIALRL